LAEEKFPKIQSTSILLDTLLRYVRLIAWAMMGRPSVVCNVVAPYQRVEVFGIIFAPLNILGNWAVSVKILDKKIQGFLLHRKSTSPLPTSTSASTLADSYASFFTDKISKLRLSLTNSSTSASPHSPSSPITPLTSLLLSLLLNTKSLKSYSTAPINNPIMIPSLLGFSKNAVHS